MATLIRGHRNGLGIFLNGGIHHFFNTAVVTKVNHFYTSALNDATHNIYGGIVTIKKRGGGNNSDIIFRNIRFNKVHFEKTLKSDAIYSK